MNVLFVGRCQASLTNLKHASLVKGRAFGVGGEYITGEIVLQ